METKHERIERLRLARLRRGQYIRVVNPVRRGQGREHELEEVVRDEEAKVARAFRKVAREDTGRSRDVGRSPWFDGDHLHGSMEMISVV